MPKENLTPEIDALLVEAFGENWKETTKSWEEIQAQKKKKTKK